MHKKEDKNNDTKTNKRRDNNGIAAIDVLRLYINAPC